MDVTVGMQLVHLEHGLAQVIDIKETMGARSFVVAAGGREHWVPEAAWREHLRPLPSRAEAEAWRAHIGTLPQRGGDAAATRRERTLNHRDFDRQLAALAEAYASGDSRGRDALEARLLPILALSLETSVDALRAQLRSSMPASVAAAETAMPPLGPGFTVVGTAQLPARVAIGDQAEVEIDILAGRWIGQVWTLDDDFERAQLVLVHSDFVSQWRTLVREAHTVATAGTDCAQALIFDPELVDDPQARDEIYDPIESGLIAGKGFSLSIGGDGDFDVRGASRDGRLVCLVTGNALGPLEEQVFHGEDRERVSIAQLAAWRANPEMERDDDADPVTTAIDTMPATPAGIAELQRVFEVAQNIDEPIAIFTATRLAKVAHDPMPHFQWLVDNFERGPAVRYPNPHNSIVGTLCARKDAAITALVVDRLAANHPAWVSGRDAFMRALLDGGHDLPATLVDSSPCARATTLRLALTKDPAHCEVARDLIEFVESYAQLERGDQAYGPPEFDALIAAMRTHSATCAACKLDWVRLLFRIKRAEKSEDYPRRMAWMAPFELEALTGATTDDALWAWLGSQ